MKKMGNSFSQWIERQVPPGLDWWTEVKWAVSGLAVGAFWSLTAFCYQFYNARNRLYGWVNEKYVLVESRTIAPFPELLDQSMAVLLLGMVLTIPLACYHYAYYYLGSRSIYVMRRLPDRWEQWRRCLMVPVLLAAACLLAIELLTFVYFLKFLLETPDPCLPSDPWRQLLYALGGGRA